MTKKKKKTEVRDTPAGLSERDADILSQAADQVPIREIAAYYGMSCRAVCRVIAVGSPGTLVQQELPGLLETPEDIIEEEL
ncbi:MAG: hypothetical protein EHM49_00170 [Deltaproteobacteria bacterium]|nr:MAG: hypothetical protein EHM49_00170 [Deltaproteobacteria bacterium]